MVTYPVSGIEDDMSFLEMMDVLNEQLVSKGEEPVVFDHDCKEGICGFIFRSTSTERHTDRDARCNLSVVCHAVQGR